MKNPFLNASKQDKLKLRIKLLHFKYKKTNYYKKIGKLYSIFILPLIIFYSVRYDLYMDPKKEYMFFKELIISATPLILISFLFYFFLISIGNLIEEFKETSLEKNILKYIKYKNPEEKSQLVIDLQLIDIGTEKGEFNIIKHSNILVFFAPELIYKNYFNWVSYSYLIVTHIPEKLDIKKANIENIQSNIKKYVGMSVKDIKQILLINNL